MLSSLRNLVVVSSLGLFGLHGCSSDESSSSGGGPAQDGGASSSGNGSSSGGTTSSSGGSTTSSSGGSTTSSSGSTSSGGVLGPVTFTLDGVPVEGGEGWQNSENRPTRISVSLGQAVGTIPKQAVILLEINLDNAKTTTGTFGLDAVSQVEGLMTIGKDPKKGTYSTRWTPAKPNGITFTLSMASNKLTMAWKGPMTDLSGTHTVDVDAELKDAELRALQK